MIGIASVSAYKNTKEKIILFPYGRDKFGIQRILESYFIIDVDLNSRELGIIMNDCFRISKESEEVPFIKDPGYLPIFEKASGAKTWKKFLVEHLHVGCSKNIDCNKRVKGYLFSSSNREKSRFYSTNKGDYVKELELGATDEEVGKALRETFKYCR